MPKKPDKIIEPIDATFEAVTKKMVRVATPIASKIKSLPAKSAGQLAVYKQVPLDLGIEVEIRNLAQYTVSDCYVYYEHRRLAFMTTKQILKALPEVTGMKFRSNYSAHVIAAEPRVIRAKAWTSSNRSMWRALSSVVGGVSAKKGKPAFR